MLAPLRSAALLAGFVVAMQGSEAVAKSVSSRTSFLSKEAADPPAVGIASWYGGHHSGRPTANGEILLGDLRTAAHRHLPFGTLVRVTNLRNGNTAVVRINDRGPFVSGRLIDLSERAAVDLAMRKDGLAPVRLEVLGHD